MSAEPTALPRRNVFLRLLRDYVWPRRARFSAGALFLLVTNHLSVTIPLEIGRAIDAITAGSDVGPHVASVAAMGIAVIGVRTLSRVLLFNPARDVEYAIRRDLFARMMAQQPTFFARRTAGEVVNRASNDVGFVRALVGYGLMQVLNVTMALALTGWRMVTLSASLTLGLLVPLVLGIVAVRAGTGAIFRLHRRAQAELGEVNDHVLGSIQGMATIQGFVAERAFLERFDARNDRLFRTRMRMSLLGSLAFPALFLSGGVAMFLVLYVGGPMALRGELSVGEVAAYATLVGLLLPPLRSLGWMLSIVQQGRASAERIFDLVDEPVDRPDRELGPVRPDLSEGPGIRVRGLSFAYPDAPGEPVLRDVDLDVPPGAFVGVFGRTGSGKSTLLRVLARLYNPPQGTVFVRTPDGKEHDLLRLDLDHWRSALAVAPQRPFLFSDTIAANVAMAAPTSPPEAVARSAARAALEGDLAVFPHGIDTVVGERGIMLSGGQRQRVALARALHRGGSVVVLDDVLSAVDHETEARLVATLGARGPGSRPTTFVVSHRLSAIRQADLIVVLDGGRIADRGTHAELVARPGIYRDTWVLQSQGEE